MRLIRKLTGPVSLAAVLAVSGGPVGATGNGLIQQHDGSEKRYPNVRILVRDESMALVSSDGKGRLVIGKAGCTKIGELVRCTPYDATLEQAGKSVPIRLKSGTVWFNDTAQKQQLTYSSQELPPRGVLVSLRTMNGTYLSLTGTVDQRIK